MTRDLWIVPPETRRVLDDVDAAKTPGDPSQGSIDAETSALHERLLELHTRLRAEGMRSVLVVLQGIDASGKDGAITSVFRGLRPAAASVTSFRVPDQDEIAHDFLWRVHARCPPAGEIAIFNRSHYEDVLAVRVRNLVPPDVWRRRYVHINAFESLLADAGTTMVKFLLHVSKHEQLTRLERRRSEPTKQWKFRADDLIDRDHWDEYVEAFEDMIEQTSRPNAPWYVVPADSKPYRDWAVASILVDVLEELDPKYPVA